MTTREELEKAVADAWRAYDIADAKLMAYYKMPKEKKASKEDQRKADEADWAEGRNQCAAIRDVMLDAAGEDAALVATAYSNYVAACLAIDDRRDAAKAKREGWGLRKGGYTKWRTHE